MQVPLQQAPDCVQTAPFGWQHTAVDPPIGTTHTSPDWQHSAASWHGSPGAGQHRLAPTGALAPQVGSFHAALWNEQQSASRPQVS